MIFIFFFILHRCELTCRAKENREINALRCFEEYTILLVLQTSNSRKLNLLSPSIFLYKNSLQDANLINLPHLTNLSI